MAKVAILVDGGFYKKTAKTLIDNGNGRTTAKTLIDYCHKHLATGDELYRIFYYDCKPLTKKVYHPLTKSTVDLSKSPLCKWHEDFLDELVQKRKVALRLGRLSDETASYVLDPKKVKELCDGTITFSDIVEDDFALNVSQKGVDMKIGVDIASLAYKKQVDKIILIAGDSDFVPASKLARREGIDFVLDPLRNHINPDLREHIDGLCTKLPSAKVTSSKSKTKSKAKVKAPHKKAAAVAKSK